MKRAPYLPTSFAPLHTKTLSFHHVLPGQGAMKDFLFSVELPGPLGTNGAAQRSDTEHTLLRFQDLCNLLF